MPLNLRSLLLGLVYLLLAVFVWLNRAVIFGFPRLEGAEGSAEVLGARFPLVDIGQFTTGEVLLGFLLLLSLIYAVFAAGMRTSSLVEIRRYAKEVESARKLADEAEASRVQALQEHIDGVMGRLEEESVARHNMLAASLGELEDRLERAGLAPAASGQATATSGELTGVEPDDVASDEDREASEDGGATG